ncbi:hypothetical protein [Planomonospora sp. ID82291]|uniref:hypothetical protein n=1 Tax=Planomonospora sp. ID82291 TaxID=2738136 RepID=UPI0018C3BD2B|nr:hypothetical protein [Planomonospora sp. ID82291]MBG0817097.1 hypothetical protein [Planomonospora sp. ID82291]
MIDRTLSVFSGRLERTPSDTGDEMHGEHGPTPRSVRRGRIPHDESPPEFPAPAGPGGQDGTVTLPRLPGKGTRARPRTLRGGLSGPVLVGGLLLLVGAGGLSAVWPTATGPSAAPGHGAPFPAASPRGGDLTTGSESAASTPAPSRAAPPEETGTGQEGADGSPPGTADGLPPGAEAGSSARVATGPETGPPGAAVVERPRPRVTTVRGDAAGRSDSTRTGGAASVGRGPGGATIRPAVPYGAAPSGGTGAPGAGRPSAETGPSGGGRPPSGRDGAPGDGPAPRADGADGGAPDGADALDPRFSSAYVCRRLPRGDWRHSSCVRAWEDFERSAGRSRQ